MEGALLESGSAVGEGSVVHPGRRIPAGEVRYNNGSNELSKESLLTLLVCLSLLSFSQLWAGNPAVFVRNLTKDELVLIEKEVGVRFSVL